MTTSPSHSRDARTTERTSQRAHQVQTGTSAARAGLVSAGRRRCRAAATSSTTNPATASDGANRPVDAVAEAGGDDDASQPGAERVRDVQRRVVHGGGQGLGLTGDIHQPQLQVDHEHRARSR